MSIKNYQVVKEYQHFSEPIRIPKDSFNSFKKNFLETNFLKLISVDEDHNTNESILKLKASFYIGIAKIPINQNFKILPRFENAKFNEMFKIVEPKYENIIHNIIQKITPNSDFFEILIERFLNKTEELFKSALRKTYKSRVEICNKIKGKILLGETIKKPDFLQGKFICEFDDFTIDTIDNQIIKLALFKLRFLAEPSQQAKILRLLIQLKDVSLKKFTSIDFEKIRYNRFNIKYKVIHTYCIMIIKNFSFGFEFGKKDCFPMFLNAWDTYEKFLRIILDKYLKKYISPDITVEKNFKGFKSWEKNKNVPDIVIMKKNQVLLLGDAKYKKK